MTNLFQDNRILQSEGLGTFEKYYYLIQRKQLALYNAIKINELS